MPQIRVIAAQRQSGKNYMMMETVVSTREFLFVQELHARGELETLTFLRGTSFQDPEFPGVCDAAQPARPCREER